MVHIIVFQIVRMMPVNQCKVKPTLILRTECIQKFPNQIPSGLCICRFYNLSVQNQTNKIHRRCFAVSTAYFIPAFCQSCPFSLDCNPLDQTARNISHILLSFVFGHYPLAQRRNGIQSQWINIPNLSFRTIQSDSYFWFITIFHILSFHKQHRCVPGCLLPPVPSNDSRWILMRRLRFCSSASCHQFHKVFHHGDIASAVSTFWYFYLDLCCISRRKIFTMISFFFHVSANLSFCSHQIDDPLIYW